MKSHKYRKSLFITIFVFFYIFLMFVSQVNKQVMDIGINVFTIVAYFVTLCWIFQSYKNKVDKQRYFLLYFAVGFSFLLFSQLIAFYNQVEYEKMHFSLVENIIRLIGYLFFFTGLMYQLKVIKNTLPMLRFLLNIVIVIISVYSISWYFMVSPILSWNQDITLIEFYISSTYHVLNISLLFTSVCLIIISKSNKTSLVLIAGGFFVQVVGDYFIINHANHLGNWIFLLWPISAFLLGLSVSLSTEYQLKQCEETEQLDYKNYHLSFMSAGFLFLFTSFNQIHETNILEKGVQLTVMIILMQLVITTIENKRTFKKLKLLANEDGNFQQTKNGADDKDNEIDKLLRKIEKIAHYDLLTELPNRNLFQKNIEQELKNAKKNKSRFALMYIDLDRFKYVNDCLGHDCGDLLLKKVAIRLKISVGKTATVARIGGDEFAIILLESETVSLERAANAILSQFEAPYNISGHELYITPSIGISVFPEGGQNSCDLIKSADVAMYSAKEGGKNNFKFFDPIINETMSKKAVMETRLRKGIKEENFSLVYQPQINIITEEIIGIEALIRWNDPVLGKVSPVDFIPLAEETGLIEPIGMWVLKTACLQLREWRELGLGDLVISVNVSIRQFQNPNFVCEVKKVLTETKLTPNNLIIEITESVMQNIDRTKTVINDLRTLGIQIAIDDFGTGYSSFSYLKNLPVSWLKIDKSFIDELSDISDGSIVKTIIDMGRNMNYTVIAEGVESFEQVDFLKMNNCFVGQGYFFSKPLSAIEFEYLYKKESFKIS